MKHKSYNPQVKGDAKQIERGGRADGQCQAAAVLLAAAASSIPAPPPRSCSAQFIRLTGFPCTLTLMGLGAFPASDPHFLGMVGMHGLL